MITWAEVRRWQPGLLQRSAEHLNKSYQKLVACSDDLRDINTPEGWHGEAAAAAAAEANRIIDQLEEYAAEVAAGRRGMGDTGDAITGVLNGAREAEDLAIAHQFSIASDGTIIDNGPPANTPDDQQKSVAQERRTIAAELRDRVEEVIRQATDIDNDFCVVLDRILSGRTIDATHNDNETTSLAAAGNAGAIMGALSILQPSPADATPAQNAAWWSALSRSQQLTLIADHPELVGNRDGVKAADRSSANMRLMDQERQSLGIKLDKLRRENSDSSEVGQIEERLRALDALSGMTHNPDGTPNPDRQLLSLDLTGDHPKAAVANGNVDTAQHVAVFTPGMNSTVDGNMHGYVDDMQGVRNSAQEMLLKHGHPAPVATVTWLGYEPSSGDPASWVDLATAENASEGSVKLARFDEGINASRPIDPHLTALGHSQGSIVTGMSLTHEGTGVDDAVVFGSPGISNTFGLANTAADLKIPEGHAYNLKADGDAVAQWVPETWRYGRAPDAMPGMNQLSTSDTIGPDGPLAGSHGHSEYTRTMPDGTDSTSKHNIAAVVADMPHLTVPIHQEGR